jgi:hypothetical protein
MAVSRIALLILCLLMAGGPALALNPLGAPQWHALDAAQREVLAPLEHDWDRMSEPHRNKWLGIADGFEQLTPAEQARIRQRMKRWADLTPEQRERARDQYRALRSLPPEQREHLREQWQQYRNESPDGRAR